MADLFDPNNPEFLNHKRQFREFVEDGPYMQKLEDMLERGETRLVINISDIRQHDPELSQGLLKRPMEFFMPLQTAVQELALSRPGSLGHGKIPKNAEFAVGLTGDFGGHRISPRQLLAHHIGQMVAVDGITTRLSAVRPKVHRTVHYCEATKNYSEQSYHDSTSLSGHPTGSVYPTKDENNNPLDTEYGLSTYVDHQTLAIQEMPERSPAGLLPRSVDVVLDGDLVDSCKPGDRVQIVGIYRALPFTSQGETRGLFRSVLVANHVRAIGRHTADEEISEADLVNIRKFGKREDAFDLLSRSIAPSIFGHEYIKKAILLLLLGGVEKNLANGTHLRGDINLLMVGDPSTAKSQLLRFVLNIAPLALNTTGRGSSGVGLTAAVVTDKETGERRLEAGAMVLADRGVVCIDEFDKMSDNDRVAIHEVMEQQTVTIAKAGIHMSLNARCSVVAAANPIYGQYDSSLPPHVNVHLPDSLLSRFDLLFIVLDQPDAKLDREISDRVLNNHRYQMRGGQMDPFAHAEEDPQEQKSQVSEVFLKYDRLLHGTGRGRRSALSEIVSVPFMKKYIQFAKQQYEPVLSQAASDYIADAYTSLRATAAQNEHTIPVTARALETLIRLSTAHAKCFLQREVTKKDCEVALEIMKSAIDHDTASRSEEEPESGESDSDDENAETDSSQMEDEDSDEDDVRMDDDDSEDGEDGGDDSSRRRRGRKRRGSADLSHPSQGSKRHRRSSPEPAAETSQDRFRLFQEALVKLRQAERITDIGMEELLPKLNESLGFGMDSRHQFRVQEATAILQRLHDDNKLMFRKDTVHFV